MEEFKIREPPEAEELEETAPGEAPGPEDGAARGPPRDFSEGGGEEERPEGPGRAWPGRSGAVRGDPLDPGPGEEKDERARALVARSQDNSP